MSDVICMIHRSLTFTSTSVDALGFMFDPINPANYLTQKQRRLSGRRSFMWGNARLWPHSLMTERLCRLDEWEADRLPVETQAAGERVTHK